MSHPAWQTDLAWDDPQPLEIPEGLRALAADAPFLAVLLGRRGISTLEQARAFLDPQEYTPADPFDLPDMDKAVQRLVAAIQDGQRVGIWGDFDVDGQTSTTILVDTLRSLGADVTYHIPVRERESHGVGLPALKTFLSEGVALLLTCDTGITAHEAVAYARARGVDTVITDHHALPPSLPDACAVVNPQRLPEGHPLRTLSGAGVAYELASALAAHFGQPEVAERQLDLAALGLVADVAALTGDARWLVQRGLQALRSTQRLGIRVLLSQIASSTTDLDEEDIGFMIAPRLNAIGRLDDANPIVSLFTTSDQTEAAITVERLEGLNARRKLLCDDVLRGALAHIERDPGLLETPALVLDHPLWPAGVIGIVASRLVELFNRPVVLLNAPPGATARGSARSIEGIDITAAIRTCQHLLLGFGGHPMAAGMSLPADKIENFRRALGRSVAQQAETAHLQRQLKPDARLTLAELSDALVSQVNRLAPFGAGNPAPVFVSHNLMIVAEETFGKDKDHRKLQVSDASGAVQNVIWWNGSGLPLPAGRFDLAYSLRRRTSQRPGELELIWLHSRDAEPTTQELSAPTRQVVDYRGCTDPNAVLAQLASEMSDLLVWQEGEAAGHASGLPRSGLRAAERLAIWNPPPDPQTLARSLEIVSPRYVYLFSVAGAMDDLGSFVRRLGGFVTYCINRLDGRASALRLAEACAQREATVMAGLNWLAAKGKITLLNSDPAALWLDVGGSQDEALAQRAEKELQHLLRETAAYRQFYCAVPPEAIFGEG